MLANYHRSVDYLVGALRGGLKKDLHLVVRPKVYLKNPENPDLSQGYT